MMKYSYFPGCSMGSTAKSYRLATEYLMDRIGIQLIEIKDWNCCGATSAHTVSDALGLALPSRPLAAAEKAHPELDIVTGCASCYGRLKTAAYRVRKDNSAKYMVEKIIGVPYEAKREIYNFLDILSTDEARNAICENITRRLTGLNLACYYGCLNVRPADITGASDRENPMAMDDITALTGATPVAWDFKTECCGAAHQNDAAKESRHLVWRILKNAQAHGADAIVTACPMCNLNLEMRQDGYQKATGQPKIPVFSISEILAVAMGASAQRIALEAHHVSSSRLLADAVTGRNQSAFDKGAVAI